MTRHIAYFIENILRPFVKELDDLLGKCKHLKISGDDIKEYLVMYLIASGIKTFIIWVIIWGIACLLFL